VAPPSRRRGWACTTFLLAVASQSSHAFWTPASTSSPSSTQLRLDVFGGIGGDKDKQQLPKDIKDAISKCRAAVQNALGGRISRMVRLIESAFASA
jgi:hypothetical protein